MDSCLSTVDAEEGAKILEAANLHAIFPLLLLSCVLLNELFMIPGPIFSHL